MAGDFGDRRLQRQLDGTGCSWPGPSSEIGALMDFLPCFLAQIRQQDPATCSGKIGHVNESADHAACLLSAALRKL